MKKLLIIPILLAALIITNTIAGRQDYHQYLNKNVRLCTIQNCYEGILTAIAEFEMCKKYDAVTNTCIEKEKYVAVFITDNEGKVSGFRAEVINSIEEINE